MWLDDPNSSFQIAAVAFGIDPSVCTSKELCCLWEASDSIVEAEEDKHCGLRHLTESKPFCQQHEH